MIAPQQFSLCSECNSVPVPAVYLLSTQLLETTSLRLYCKSSGECEFSREQDKCARGLQPEMPFTSRYSEPRSLLIPASVEPHDREACSNLSITLSKIDNCIIITFWIYGWYWTIWISTYQCWNNSHSPEVHRLEMSAADLVHNIFFSLLSSSTNRLPPLSRPHGGKYSGLQPRINCRISALNNSSCVVCSDFPPFCRKTQ